jgi:hypothetical protein
MYVFYLPLSLVILFLSKKWLTATIAKLVHRLGGSSHTLIVIWSLIFLPGTVIHELSHFFLAIITGARTGKIGILPEYLEDDWADEAGDKSVALGYVQTQKLNPLQGFFVGISPFITGLIILIWLGSLIQSGYLAGNIPLVFLEGYLFFTVANSFFPSWSDIKQTLPLVVIFLVVLIVFWIMGIHLLFTPGPQIISLANTVTTTVLISTFVNATLVGLLSAVIWLTKNHAI